MALLSSFDVALVPSLDRDSHLNGLCASCPSTSSARLRASCPTVLSCVRRPLRDSHTSLPSFSRLRFGLKPSHCSTNNFYQISRRPRSPVEYDTERCTPIRSLLEGGSRRCATGHATHRHHTRAMALLQGATAYVRPAFSSLILCRD